MAVAAGIGGEDADLTVLDPSGGPGVLACHTNRVHALLQQTRLIHYEDTARIAESIKRITPDTINQHIGRPGRASQKRLDAIRPIAAPYSASIQPVLRSARQRSVDERTRRYALFYPPEDWLDETLQVS